MKSLSPGKFILVLSFFILCCQTSYSQEEIIKIDAQRMKMMSQIL